METKRVGERERRREREIKEIRKYHMGYRGEQVQTLQGRPITWRLPM
jgi:hypothetical protein